MRWVRKLIPWRGGGSGQALSLCIAHSGNGKGDNGRSGQRFKTQTSHEHRRETIGSVRSAVSGGLGEQAEYICGVHAIRKMGCKSPDWRCDRGTRPTDSGRARVLSATTSVPFIISMPAETADNLVHYASRVYIPVAASRFHTVFNPMGFGNYFIVSYLMTFSHSVFSPCLILTCPKEMGVYIIMDDFL